MISSKERGMAPFKSKKLDRLPMWYNGAPETTRSIVEFLGAKNSNEALYDILKMDYKTFRPKYTGQEAKADADGRIKNIWGIKRTGHFSGQAVNHPLAGIESLEDFAKYNFPSTSLWDCKITEQELNEANNSCIIGGSWAQFFHTTADLLGMENMLVMLYTEPELIKTVISTIFEFYYEHTKRCFEENPGIIDFMFMGNDFGTQRALLMSPELWNEFFGIHIKRMVELSHKHGAVAGLHSCGDIHLIIPYLIDMGMDVINPIQVNAEHMNPIVLKREFGKDIVFFGGIDENVTLIHGTEHEVREETKRIIDILGSDGKYIVAASHDYLLPEVPARNIVAMYEEAAKYSSNK